MTEKIKHHKSRRKTEGKWHTEEKVKKLLNIKRTSVSLNVDCNNTAECKLSSSGKLRLELGNALELSNEYTEGLFAIRLANHHHLLSSSVELECVKESKTVYDNSANNDKDSNDIHANKQPKVVTLTTLDVKRIDKEYTIWNVKCDERKCTSDLKADKTSSIRKETEETCLDSAVEYQKMKRKLQEMTREACNDEHIISANESNTEKLNSTELNVEENELACDKNENSTLELVFDFDEQYEQDESIEVSNDLEEEEVKAETISGDCLNSHVVETNNEEHGEVKNAQRRVLYLGFNSHAQDKLKEENKVNENDNKNSDSGEKKQAHSFKDSSTLPSSKQTVEEDESEEWEEEQELSDKSESYIDRELSEERKRTEHNRMTLFVEEGNVYNEQTTLYLCTVHLPPLASQLYKHDDELFENNNTEEVMYVAAVTIQYVQDESNVIDSNVNEKYNNQEKTWSDALDELLIVAPNYTLLVANREMAYLLCPLCHTLQQSTNITLELSNYLSTTIYNVENNSSNNLEFIPLHSFPAEISTIRLLFVVAPLSTTTLNDDDDLMSHLPFTLSTSCRQNEQACLTQMQLEHHKLIKLEHQQQLYSANTFCSCNIGEYREIAEHCVAFDITENDRTISYYYLHVDHLPYKLVLHQIIVDILQYIQVALLQLPNKSNGKNRENWYTDDQDAKCVAECANMTTVNQRCTSLFSAQEKHKYNDESTPTLEIEHRSHKTEEECNFTVIVTEFSHRTLALHGGVDAFSPHVLVMSSSTLRSLCTGDTGEVLRAKCSLVRALVQNRLFVTCENSEFWSCSTLARCGDLCVEQNAEKINNKNVKTDINCDVMHSAFSYALALEYMELRYVNQSMAISMFDAHQEDKSASSNRTCFHFTNSPFNNKTSKCIPLLEWENYLLQEGSLTSALLHLLQFLFSTEEEQELMKRPLSPLTEAANKKNTFNVHCSDYCQENTSLLNQLDKQCRFKQWGMNLFIYFQQLQKAELQRYNFAMNASKDELFIDTLHRQTSIIDLLATLLLKLEQRCSSDTFDQIVENGVDSLTENEFTRQRVNCNAELPLLSVLSEIPLCKEHIAALRAMTANNVLETNLSYTIYPFDKRANELRHDDYYEVDNGAPKLSNYRNMEDNNADVLYWKIALTCHFTQFTLEEMRSNSWKKNLFDYDNKKAVQKTDKRVHENDTKINKELADYNIINSRGIKENELHQATFTLPLLFFVFVVYTYQDMREEYTSVNRDDGNENNTRDAANSTIKHSTEETSSKLTDKVNNSKAYHDTELKENYANNSKTSNYSSISNKLEINQKVVPHVKLVQANSLRWNELFHNNTIINGNNNVFTKNITKRVEFVIYNEWVERQRTQKNRTSAEIDKNRQTHANRKRRRRDTSTELLEKKMREEMRQDANTNTTMAKSLPESEIDNKNYKRECTQMTNGREAMDYNQENKKHKSDNNKSSSNIKYHSSTNIKQLQPTLIPFICIDKTALSPLSSVNIDFNCNNNNDSREEHKQCVASQLFAFIETKSSGAYDCKAENSVLCALISHLIGFTTFSAAYPERVRQAQESVLSNHQCDLDYDDEKLTLLSDSVIVAYSTLLNSLLLKCLDSITVDRSDDNNGSIVNNTSNNSSANKNMRIKNVIRLSENAETCKASQHVFLLQMISTVMSTEFVIRAVVDAANYYRKKIFTGSKNDTGHDKLEKDNCDGVNHYKQATERNRAVMAHTQTKHKHTFKSKNKSQHSQKRHWESEVCQHSSHDASPNVKEKSEQRANESELEKRMVLEYEGRFKPKNIKHHNLAGKRSTDETLLLDSHVLMHAFWHIVLEEKVMHKLLYKLNNTSRSVSPYHLITHVMRSTREEVQMQHVVYFVQCIWHERYHLERIKRESNSSRNSFSIRKSENVQIKMEMPSLRTLSLRTDANTTISLMQIVLQNYKQEEYCKKEEESQSEQVTRSRQTQPSMEDQVDSLTAQCAEILNNSDALSTSESDQ